MEVLRDGVLPPRSLVLAAHPDDEVVGAAVLLARSADCGVVHLTDGAPSDSRLWGRFRGDRESYARLRRTEAETALALAGIPASRIHCLLGVDQEAAREIPALARRLSSLLLRLRPPVLVLQPYEGGHPDHDAAAAVGRCAAFLLGGAGPPPLLVEMTSYHARGAELVVGEFLPSAEPVTTLVATAAERALKRRMLECHQSQAETLAPFLAAQERFRRAAPADFAQPPHAGETYSERMGWMRAEAFCSLARAGFEELGMRSRFDRL